MGLMEIHDPDALCHFSSVTYCPWCGKEGQNEGTVFNHLWTVHYRLGLVCSKCHDYPYTTAKTHCCHCQQDFARPERNALTSQFHLSSHQEKQNHLSWRSPQGGQDGMVYTRLPHQEYPYPPLQPWRRTSGKGVTCQPAHPITNSPTRLNWAATCYS